jgi:hypothetical protein
MEDFVRMEAQGVTAGKTSRIALAGGIVLLLAIPLLLAFLAQEPDLHTIDYVSVWAGAQIIGPNLYDSTRLEQIEHTVSPLIESKRYIRPPYYVMMFWPLGGLPYRAAYAGFVLMNLAALLLFLRIWRFEVAAILACALFLPLEWSFGLGQDAPIMMAIVAGAAQLIQRRRDFAGGALLALFTVKPHLFLFLPVVLIAQRKYRALAGLAVGGVALYLLAAAFVGIDWPLKSMAAAMSNEATFVPSTPGVAGLLRKLHAPGWVLLPAVIAGIAMVYRRARAIDWLPAVALAIAAGVVFAPRAQVYDGSFFLLLLLLVATTPALVVIAGVAVIAVVTPAALVGQLAGIAIFLGGWRRLRQPLIETSGTPVPAGAGALLPGHL